MGNPFMGEIKIISWNFPPKAWAFANGQLLPINQNQALFSLFGTTYGGNGQTNFALPNLQGRVPIHFGNGFTQGQAGGEETHTITMGEMPAHNHFFMANGASGDTDAPFLPTGSIAAFNAGYGGMTNTTTLAPGEIKNVGGSQAHENKQPYLVLNFVVALSGIFPSRN
jgi:microcystin-dependent protein